MKAETTSADKKAAADFAEATVAEALGVVQSPEIVEK